MPFPVLSRVEEHQLTLLDQVACCALEVLMLM